MTRMTDKFAKDAENMASWMHSISKAIYQGFTTLSYNKKISDIHEYVNIVKIGKKQFRISVRFCEIK